MSSKKKIQSIHSTTSSNREALVGRTAEQQKYISSIKNFDMVISEGDAGTGKTFPPSVLALDMLFDNRTPIQSIKLVRPNEELGNPIGFLKGDLYEKMAPWMVPFMDGFEHRITKNHIRDLVNNEKIEFVPTAYLRGRTWSNCFVIVDEAQNLKYEEMKCLLRRIGEDCKIVICSDLDQCDLRNPKESGMHLLYSIDDKIKEKELRAPYSWHVLEGSVRSDMCQFFGQLIKEVEGDAC